MISYIGLTKGKPGWVKVLKQEGISYRKFSPGDNPPVLIVDSLTNISSILDYLSGGGTIITSSEYAGKLLKKSSKSVKIEYIVPDGSEIFRNVGIIDTYSMGFVLQGNGFGKINNHVPAVQEFAHNGGICIAIPFDVDSVMCDSRSMMKFFYSEGRRFPAEIVSTVTMGETRKLIVNIIRYLFRKKGLYYINKWYYPEEKENAFTFRIDTDESGFDEISETYKIARKKSINLTFFIDFSNINIENDARRLKELRNQEVAVHCFEHRISKDPVRNRKNFSRARRTLFTAGFAASGIAIPYGVWNSALGSLIQELGFKYSSEFSFSYDDLPSFPFFDRKFSKVLQIPVHPISPGGLLYSKFGIDEINRYFERIIEEKTAAGEPLFFYGHSEVLSREPEILEHILGNIVGRENIWKGTYREFYNWWIDRDSQNLDLTITGDILEINGLSESKKLSLQVISPDGRRAIIPARDKINLKTVVFPKINKRNKFEQKRLRIKSGKLKLKFKEIENWFRR